MRIALSFPDVNRRGGVERVVSEAANYLAANNHEICLIARSVEPGILDRRVTHYAVTDPRLWKVSLGEFALTAPKVFESITPPIDVHGAFTTASAVGGVLWVQAVHLAWMQIARSTRGMSGRLRQAFNPFHRVALSLERSIIGGRRYKKLIALTPAVAEDLKRLYSVPETDIVVLPNGVNPNEFSISDHSRKLVARRELGLPFDKPIILFVANETQRKGFVPLLQALASIRDSQAHILAVGRLGGMKQWQKTLLQFGLQDRITFTGPTSNAALAYAASDLFALPTIYEAWGLVIVEALASGLPVVTSRLAGAAEAIREGETGYLLSEPHNASEIAVMLRRLLAGEHADAATIAASIERYHWSKILCQYEQILMDVAATG